MKRKVTFITLLLFCSLTFAAKWAVLETVDQGFYMYTITTAPAENKLSLGTEVYCYNDYIRYKNKFANQCKERILEYLKNNNFEIKTDKGKEYIFLPADFLSLNYKISKKKLAYVYDFLEKNYVGFSLMKKKGFSKGKFLKLKYADDLKAYLVKYIDDGHFFLQIDDIFFSQPRNLDEGSVQSKDPLYTYFEKATSNAYYIRFTSCVDDVKNIGYNTKLAPAAYFASQKDFLILDARSNMGGTDIPQVQLRQTLDKLNYTGTVIVLQDKWSVSAGELWEIFGPDDLYGLGKAKFKRLLVGTHSGGMQNYGNCKLEENPELKIRIWYGTKDFTGQLPANYLGDCKGYEPDIWATTETMKQTLVSLGVDLTGVEFQ